MDTFLEHLTVGYFDFKGKSSRRDFWSYLLSLMIINAICFFVLCLIYFSESTTSESDFIYYESLNRASKSGNLFLSALFVFAVWYMYLIIPTLAITVRRLHDTGRSGWWVAAYTVSTIMFIFGVAQTFFSALATLLSLVIFAFCLMHGQSAKINGLQQHYGKPV